MREIMKPTVNGMETEGHPYSGFLYAGLMITPQGEPKVLEFNCRMGDPETQPILMRLQSDLVSLCLSALQGQLHKTQAQWDSRCSLSVVLTAGGYPDHYKKGDPIQGLDKITNSSIKVFHGGTKLIDGNIVTDGGRVLAVTALGDTLMDAKNQAYSAVKQIDWPNCYYRKDIGYRALQE
jgi:phosphoribosylamine--glycine ligase